MVGDKRLGDLRRLREVVIPDGIEKIGDAWFAGSWIQSVTVPASVRTIGTEAFDHCSDLGSVTFAEGSRLERIEMYAFCKSGLKTFAFPSGVKYVGACAFQDCG